jgi:hypothetical protein
MRFIHLYTLLICFLICSCKLKDEVYHNVKITMKVKVGLDDKFQLFYSDSYINDYNEQNSQIKNVKKSEDTQEVIFEIPNRFAPNRIRIDFGDQIDQKEIILEEISIVVGGKFKSFGPEEISNFFEFNKFATYDVNSKRLLLTPIEGSYDPFLISKNLQSIFVELK